MSDKSPFGFSHISRMPSAKKFLRSGRILLILAVVLSGLVVWHLRNEPLFQPEAWIGLVKQHPIASPAVFVPVYAVSVVFLLPTLPLNVIAGVLWGPVLGSVFALSGSILGAVSAFALARATLGQPLATRFDSRFVSWLQEQFSRHGWKIVALVRLNPIFPGPVNFLFAFTSISFRTYVWSTTAFLAPPTIAFAIVGHSLGKIVLRGYLSDIRSALLLVGTSVFLLVLLVIGIRLRLRIPRKDEAPANSKEDYISP